MNDIIISICAFLNDYDKLNLLSITHTTNKLKNQIYFDSKISIKDIKNIWYGDRCRNLWISARQLQNINKSKIPSCVLPNINHLTLTNYEYDGCDCGYCVPSTHNRLLVYLQKYIAPDILYIKIGDNLHLCGHDSKGKLCKLVGPTKTYLLTFIH